MQVILIASLSQMLLLGPGLGCLAFRFDSTVADRFGIEDSDVTQSLVKVVATGSG